MKILGGVRTARMRTVVAVVAGTAILGVVAAAAALGEFPGGTGYTALGPFTGSPINEIGSCGNPWATEAPLTRYRVFPQAADGSYVVEQDYLGVGHTLAGSSPHAWRPEPRPPWRRASERRHGDQDLALITHGTFDPSGSCSSPCFFAQFTPAFFGPTAVVTQLSAVDFEGTHCNGSIVDDGSAGASPVTSQARAEPADPQEDERCTELSLAHAPVRQPSSHSSRSCSRRAVRRSREAC